MSKRPPTTTEITPSGIEITFWDSVGADGLPQQRRYVVDGSRLPSVTTILGILDKPALLDWAANLAREGLEWRAVRDEAGGRGHSAHDLILRTITDEQTSLADLPDEHRPWGQAAYRWLRARSPQVIEAERMVASTRHGYSGRFDLLATYDEWPGLILTDFKTVSKWSERDGKRYPPYAENLLQLDLYARAIDEAGYADPTGGLIVRLGPDGTYDETFVDLKPDRGLAILEAYKARAAAGRELRRAMTEAVAA